VPDSIAQDILAVKRHKMDKKVSVLKKPSALDNPRYKFDE
jgi:hypothetical protein